MEERVYNFSAGPAMIAESVLKKAADELVCYPGCGMSVMEMSHRSGMYIEIFDRTKALLKELMNVPDDYEILFLQGGATLQFSAVPLNLLSTGKADYVDSGNFAHLAAEEAKKYADVHIAASSREDTYTYVPDTFDWRPDADYAYITTNNTIYGTRYTAIPDTGNVAAGGRHELQHSLRALRRDEVRRDLRRRAEEHRPRGPVHRDRAPRPDGT